MDQKKKWVTAMKILPSHKQGCDFLSSFTELIQNTTIEERVALLQIQVVEIDEDLTDIDERVILVEGDVSFLFDEQVIQDERLLELEQTSDEFVVELAEIIVNIQGEHFVFSVFELLADLKANDEQLIIIIKLLKHSEGAKSVFHASLHENSLSITCIEAVMQI